MVKPLPRPTVALLAYIPAEPLLTVRVPPVRFVIAVPVAYTPIPELLAVILPPVILKVPALYTPVPFNPTLIAAKLLFIFVVALKFVIPEFPVPFTSINPFE